MGNTKTLLITFLAVIVVGAGLVAFLNWESITGGKKEPFGSTQTDSTQTEEFEQEAPSALGSVGEAILARIVQMKEMEWEETTSRLYFEDLAFEIGNAFKSENISPENEEYLSNMLELHYVDLAKRKSSDVLRNSTDLSDLHPIHNELKFISDSIGRKELVAESLKHTSQVYGLRNAVVEMQNGLRTGNATDSKLEELYQRIEEYPNREHFRNSALVKRMSADGLQELRNGWRQLKKQQLVGPVQQYCRTEEYNKSKSNDFLNAIRAAVNNRRINTDRSFVRQMEELSGLLNKHKDAHTEFDLVMRFSGSCEDKFEGFQFYIDKCKATGSGKGLNNSSN